MKTVKIVRIIELTRTVEVEDKLYEQLKEGGQELEDFRDLMHKQEDSTIGPEFDAFNEIHPDLEVTFTENFGFGVKINKDGPQDVEEYEELWSE